MEDFDTGAFDPRKLLIGEYWPVDSDRGWHLIYNRICYRTLVSLAFSSFVLGPILSSAEMYNLLISKTRV